MRAVVEIAQFQDLPITEIAKILDISVAAAKSRLLQARATLRKSLALRAIARTRRELRHEFSRLPVANRVSRRRYASTNLHAATVTLASVNVSKAFYDGACQMSPSSNSPIRREGLERNSILQRQSGSEPTSRVSRGRG
jgi:hypothetical protein